MILLGGTLLAQLDTGLGQDPLFGSTDTGQIIVTAQSSGFAQYLPFLIGAVVLAVIFIIGINILRAKLHAQAHARGGEDRLVTLRIILPKFRSEEEARQIPTAQITKEKVAVGESIFSALGGLKPDHGLHAWLYGESDVFSFEIVAMEKLISFYVTIPLKYQEFFSEQMHAQYPDAEMEDVGDYNMFSPTGVVLGGYLKFKRKSAFPLKTYKEIEVDPLNALTNALSKVPDGDGVAIQFLVRPTHHSWREPGMKIVKNMQKGMTLEQALKGNAGEGWRDWFFSEKTHEKEKEKLRERKMSAAETKMLEGIENKLSKAGLESNIRIVASSATAESAQLALSNVIQAFGQYNIYEYGNSLEKSIPGSKRALIEAFIFRTFSEGYKLVLNTEELTSLWHLPLPTSETPNIRWMHARSAPPPTNIPTEGLLLGYNEYRGKKTDIFIKEADRLRHTYIIGKTGTGKSEFIKNLAVQDIRAGRGIAVIDPHGDLADGLLELIPKDRIDDVIYFNPSDTDKPMGLNMLEAPNEGMRDFAVQEMISVFYMLFPPEMIGPMFEHNMRNYMLTLMADVENPGTLIEIPRMIADEAFQKKWVDKVKDPVVRSFWEDEMAKTSDYHKSEMMGYLVSKVGRFVENEMMRNIIGQTKSAFNFRDIMDNGKILLVNLSKGKTGDVNANLLGLILVSKLQMAAFARADMPEEKRRPFYLYIDEFQNFITPSIATILSEARKYKLSLIMAHQYMGQLVKDGKTEIRDAVLGNVGSYFVSRVGPEDTEVLAKIFEPTFSGYDLMNNSALTWNVKLIIDGSQGKPFNIKVFPKQVGNKRVGAALKEISRIQYGRDKDEVSAEITERAGLGPKGKKITAPPPPPVA
ncbi:MAG: type IV secretion system DNA-binding domain-containing protein [Patescibacteria group bacterium]